jgi:hypothetical protein
MTLDSSTDALIGVLEPIRDYLPGLVLCGGWTLFVYRRWLVGNGPDPLLTLDVDLAAPHQLPLLPGTA